MAELTIPTVNANDETYVLLEWLVPAGTRVDAGDCVATIETSKAVADLVVEESGYLSHALAAGTVCRPGDVAGRLDGTPETVVPQAVSARPETPPDGTGPVLTRAARELADRHGISARDLAALGKRLVRSEDVTALVEGRGGSGRVELSAHQRAVARAVARSHATIPSAFTVVKVAAGALLRHQRALSEHARAFIGLPELVVVAVAAQRAAFPVCFATLREEDWTIEPAARSDIGVTLDVGKGLFVPVLRDAENLTPQEISAQLTRLRVRALRGTMRESDLGPCALTLALHTDPGVVLARPIIFPGQTCTLSLASTQRELRLGDAGQVEEHDYFLLGLAYDHRVVNGHDAARFLTAVRAALESPPPVPVQRTPDQEGPR